VFSQVNKIKNDIRFSSRLGSLSKKIEQIELELPFPINMEYKVIQGNNTNHTHSSDWSRYAVDFDLKKNDTICSATNGFVVGVVDKYELGGEGDKWKPYGNYITIYEPISGLFTQYVHLVKNGSFVKVGDEVISGQVIGLSGETGQTDIEHLHFNCLIPANSNDGLKSIPFKFKEGYISEKLNKNDIVKK
ncbi:MAG: M23 family metallopeptidase, partial [Cellulophaga sp.]